MITFFLPGPKVAHSIAWLQTEHLYLCVPSGPFPRKLPVFNFGSATKIALPRIRTGCRQKAKRRVLKKIVILLKDHVLFILLIVSYMYAICIEYFFFVFFFNLFTFMLCAFVFYLHVCLYENIRSWSYRQLWVTMWVLGFELGSC